MRAAVTGLSNAVELATIEIETRLGDRYSFPAMDKQALATVIAKDSNRVPEGTPTLALVNASYAVLSVPFSIVQTITVDGETWWKSPISGA